MLGNDFTKSMWYGFWNNSSKIIFWKSAWVVELVKHPTPGSGSDHDLKIIRSPHPVLHSMRRILESFSPASSAPPPALSLSKINLKNYLLKNFNSDPTFSLIPYLTRVIFQSFTCKISSASISNYVLNYNVKILL